MDNRIGMGHGDYRVDVVAVGAGDCLGGLGAVGISHSGGPFDEWRALCQYRAVNCIKLYLVEAMVCGKMRPNVICYRYYFYSRTFPVSMDSV